VAQALRPYPHVLTVNSNEDKLGSSIYHAFEAKVQKRFASGLQYLVSYTYSKSITDVNDVLSGLTSSSLQNAGNRRAARAISGSDTPQTFWLSTIYELPFGRGRRYLQSGVADKILGGWNISGILSYQSGVPLAVTQSNRLAIFNSGQRPDRVLGVDARNSISYGDYDPAIDRLFNPDAFTQAQTDAFGNAAARLSDARGLGLRREDLNLGKMTYLTEGVSLEFTTQIFNLFNRNQWGRAEPNTSSSNFGKVSRAGPGRFVQFGLRLRF